jgi:hypothetical protein
MLRECCKIEIDNSQKKWTIERVHQIKITGDSSTLADTCSIELPKNIKWAEDKDCPIKRGDKVSVWLGYNEQLKLRFVGYVLDVKAGIPIVLKCEDSVFLLRNTSMKKKLYKNTTINNILKDLLPKGIRVKVSGEVKINSWKTTAETVAGEISLLCESYPLTIFFELDDDDKPTLFVFTSWINGRKNTGTFTDTTNIISHNLEYRRSEDVKVRIKGISRMTNGKKIEYIEGDGQVIIKNYYDLSMDDLKVMVKNELKRMKWEGLTGKFKTFGQPIVKKMNTVDVLIDGIRKARYIVKGVDVEFGQDGYKQEIELQRKVVDE